MESWLRTHCNSLITNLDDEQISVLAIFDSIMSFRPTEDDASYCDRVIIVSTDLGTGVSGCPHPKTQFRESEVLPKYLSDQIHPCLEVALFDAFMSSACPQGERDVQLVGNPRQKSIQRAELLVETACRLVKPLNGYKNVHVAMVGAVGTVINLLGKQGFDVKVAEFDETLVGVPVADVLISHGSMTPQMVEEADVAIVTGMTISTNTLGPILNAAKSGSTPLVFYAQTGANILVSLDFPTPTIVVQEVFPHYMWPGVSNVTVHGFRQSSEL